ncbi:MAG: type I restriction enzyme HsdR N-terminal domain-containing protein [bacterium]
MQQITTQQFFFFIADESDIVYNARSEREETRGKFLVRLLEEQGYEMRDIQLDFEGPKYEILGSADLVVFGENEKPFLIAQFLRDKPSLTEISLAREALHEKIKDLKAKYGVLAWANKKETFLLNNGRIKRVNLHE